MLDMQPQHPLRDIVRRPKSQLDLGLYFLIIVVALLARIIPQPRTVDDAFITFRYSRNLVEGEGFVYNPDSKVLGTTTPLYALTMAGFGAAFGEDYPWYALAVNAVADTLSVILLVMIGHYLTGSRRAGLLVGTLWAVAPFSVTFAIGGMETSVHNLWMIAAWAAYLDQRRGGWVGAFAALGILTRPDALIWVGPLLLHQLAMAWWKRDSQASLWDWLPWRDYLAGLILGLPWVIFAAWYFGSPLPHTVNTKSVVYLVDSTQALIRLLQHYSTPFHQHIILGVVIGVVLGLFLFPALALIGLRAVTKRVPAALPILTYPWLYFAVFAIQNPLIFRWYLTPPLPAYFLAIVAGGLALLAAFESLVIAGHLRRVGVGLAMVSVVFLLSDWTLRPDHGPDRPAPEMAFHELELFYEQMAQRLVEEQGVGPDTLVAVGDIGAVGFHTNARILDTVGLVTKELNQYYSRELQDEIVVDDANYAIPPQMIFDYQPEYLVVMADFVTGGLEQDPRFEEQYALLYSIETEYYGDEMRVYQRR